MRRLAVTALAAALAAAVPWRPAAALTARQILDRARELDDTTRHWTDRRESLTLTLRDSSGRERHRELTLYTRRYPEGEEKSLSFFSAPAEVKGTAFLQWTHKGADDEQWLYLPRFRRTRRIATRLRDQKFVGSDFTYRDLQILAEVQRWTESEADAVLLGEETIAGGAAYKIEMRPHAEDMPYARILLWMDEKELTPRQLDFFDRRDEREKSLALEDLRQIGAVPTPFRLQMRTLAAGSRTVVELRGVKYDTALPEDLFTNRYLERGGY